MNSVRSVTIGKSPESDRRGQTRQQILGATRRLLAQGEAFAKLSIQRIVDEAGVSRATFYLHFRSKRELIAALGRTETSEWEKISSPFLMNPKANRKVFERAVKQLIVAWRRHHAVLAGIIELAEYDEETRYGWRDTIHEIARGVGQALQKRQPQLSADQAEHLGRLIVWAGERYLHQEARDPCPDGNDLIVHSLTNLVWKLFRG